MKSVSQDWISFTAMRRSTEYCLPLQSCDSCEIATRGDLTVASRVQVYVSFALQHATQKHLMPPWLIHLGALGVFAVSTIDASIIPLPLPGSTDVLVLLLAAHRGNPWLLAIAAISGSIIGGYSTWSAGQKGGE